MVLVTEYAASRAYLVTRTDRGLDGDRVRFGGGRGVMATQTATILVSDLVGSTELRAALGEDRAEEVRRLHDRVLTEAAERAGGIVVKGLGDGLLVQFAGAAEAVKSIDPTRRYGRSTADALPGDPLTSDVSAALDLGAILVSAELVGICRRVLDMTLEYVKDRKQFGRPVGSFQAVQHRCARMLLDTESARAVTYFAAWAADADRERLPEASSLAKAAASKAGVETTSSAIQAHGGIGFTWEADVHWFYKRAQLDAAMLGGASFHKQRLARIASN